MDHPSGQTNAPPEPSAAASLPPEALQLAGKIYDLARAGNDELLGAYLDAGIPANLTNEKGNTLLMLAAYSGHASTVRLLHSKGAELDRLNDNGQSPLAGAIFKNEEAVIKTLVELGADARVGAPSAVDTAKIFKKPEWLDFLGATEEERNAPLRDFGKPT